MTSLARSPKRGQVMTAVNGSTGASVWLCARIAIEPRDLADRIRAAYEDADQDAFGALLAEDARWGDDDHPHGCRSRADVLPTLAQWLDSGVTADVLSVDTGLPWGCSAVSPSTGPTRPTGLVASTSSRSS